MDPRFSSGQVSDDLDVPPHRLDYLTRDRQVRPAKGPTGAFEWTLEDIKLAARLLDVDVPESLLDSDSSTTDDSGRQQSSEGGAA